MSVRRLGVFPGRGCASRGVLLGLFVGTVLWTAGPSAGWAQDPDYVMHIADVTAVIGECVDVPYSVASFALPITGFQAGICDDSALVNIIDFGTGPVLAQMNGGVGPDFLSFTLDPVGGSGVTCGTVFSFSGQETISPGTPLGDAVVMTYETFATQPGETAPLWFCDTLGLPEVVTFVTTDDGEDRVPTQISGVITFVAGTDYIRGDSNASGSVDIADPIFTLAYLFLNGPALCQNAMDANGDQGIDLADVLLVLFYTNGLGPAPAAPFPGCGNASPGIGCDDTACP